MTAKDYRLIARTIRELHNREEIAEAFAEALGAENPAFDAERFMVAATNPLDSVPVRDKRA